ncbi:hypothetical protein HDU67_004335 [Dinochytrium kinnereticum]|nr:hypothetical protein HDU67_004335 [Dinochytrium kinnereticum]
MDEDAMKTVQLRSEASALMLKRLAESWVPSDEYPKVDKDLISQPKTRSVTFLRKFGKPW